MQWKGAVEMLTDMEVNQDLYQPGRKSPFPFEKTGHCHKAVVHQSFVCPSRDLFVNFKCEEAWESLTNNDAIRVWTDASVTEARAAAAVLIEGRGDVEQKDGFSKWKAPVLQKALALDLNVKISHVDEDHAGKVYGFCALCEKPFEAFIRTFLSRGCVRCDCGGKVALTDTVRKKADEFGGLEIFHVDDHREGKVQGACLVCKKPFDVFIRTFLYRGPTKCDCLQRKKSVCEPPKKDEDIEESTKRVVASRGVPFTSIPTMIYYFPTRGDSFRSESLGILGAKRILIEKGNLEAKEELHFLGDNKANIDLLQQMQRDENFVSRHSIFREHQRLERELLTQWKVIRYIFVKGHVGVPHNELYDTKAKF